jgi:hypothetical protein
VLIVVVIVLLMMAARLRRFQVMAPVVRLRAVFTVLADGLLQLILSLVDPLLASVVVGSRRNRACDKTQHDQGCDYQFAFK